MDINSVVFPNRLASKEEKLKPSYGLAFARAIYQEYKTANYSIYNKIGRFVENRKYAEGLQSIEKFKDILDLNGDASYLNLDFQSVSLVPKFVNIIVGELTDQEYSIQANAVDEKSAKKLEDLKDKLYMNLILGDVSKKLEETSGISLVDKSLPVPEDEEDLNVYADTTLKLAVEAALEVCLKYIFNANEYDDVLKERIIRDLITLKMCATKEYFDENDDIRMRYVDPANLVVPYTVDPYFRDLEYTGEVHKMTFTQFVELTGGKLSKEEYEDVYKKVGGNVQQLNLSEEHGRYYINNSGLYGNYKDYYLTVLDFEFASNNHNITKEKTYVTETDFLLKDRNQDYVPPKDSKYKKEVISKSYRVYYEGSWVVGSDCIFNYGLQKNMSRPKSGNSYSAKPKSRYNIIAPNIFDTENKSIVEQMIPFDDQISLANLKLQQAMIKARPSGIAVDASALEEVLRGKGNDYLDPLEVIKIFDQTGNIFYRSQSLDGDEGMINQKPIFDLPNGLHQSALSFITIYNHNLDMIRNVTGINEMRDGSTPNSKSLVGVQKLSVLHSRNSTKFLNDAYLYMFKSLAKGAALMLQTSALKNGLKRYSLAIGKESLDILEIVKDLPYIELGIDVNVLPDAEERAYLDGLIQAALTNGSIELEDAMMIRDVSKVSIKKATHLLRKLRKDKAKQEMEKSAALQQQNAQTQIQSAQAAMQGELAIIQAKHQAKMEEISLEYNMKKEIVLLTGKVDAELELVKSEEKKEQIDEAMEKNLDDTSLKGGMKQPQVFSKPTKNFNTKSFD